MAINAFEVIVGMMLIVSIVLIAIYFFCICWWLKSRANEVRPEIYKDIELDSINVPEATEIKNSDERDEDIQKKSDFRRNGFRRKDGYSKSI